MEDYIITEENIYNVKKTVLEPFEITENINGLTLCSEEDKREIIVADIRMINGMITSPYNWDGGAIYCDYCNHSCQEEFNTNFTYYYCMNCHNDMCKLCHGETSEEIALKNGAKNYHLRKDKLDLCRSHDLQERKLGKSYSFDTEDYKDNIYLVNKVWSYMNIGSLLDWIPIYKDEEYDMILLNRNKHSPYFNYVGLISCDDHGRLGLYTTPNNLEDVLNKIKQYDVVENYKNWETFYNFPIKRYMKDNNMPIHYG